jgi:uncharacterized protein with gpF-like domain
MKLTHISAVLLSQFVAADAGSVEAQHDARLCAVYTAYRTALKDGNKTQLMLVQAACDKYATPKACLELVGAAKVNAAARRAHATYAAYRLALAQVGIPSLMKGADIDAVEAQAAALAGEFVEVITVALTPETKPEASAEEKAAAKAAKEAEKAKAAKEAEKAHRAEVQAAAQKIAETNALTLDDMARAVINAMRAGALSAELLQELDSALDAVAATVVPVVVKVEPEHAPT